MISKNRDCGETRYQTQHVACGLKGFGDQLREGVHRGRVFKPECADTTNEQAVSESKCGQHDLPNAE